MTTEATDTKPHAAKRPRGRPKALSDEHRRAEITNVARKTFEELGYSSTTTDIVAARCKISKQTLYRLFPSKMDLFLAVVAAHRQMMLDLPRPADENEGIGLILKKIFMIDISEEQDAERHAFLTIVMREGAQIPELREILRREGIDRSRRNLADWLEQQANEGKIVIDDSISHARILMDMIFGAAGRDPNEFVDRDARRHHLERCIDIFVRATKPA